MQRHPANLEPRPAIAPDISHDLDTLPTPGGAGNAPARNAFAGGPSLVSLPIVGRAGALQGDASDSSSDVRAATSTEVSSDMSGFVGSYDMTEDVASPRETAGRSMVHRNSFEAARGDHTSTTLGKGVSADEDLDQFSNRI